MNYNFDKIVQHTKEFVEDPLNFKLNFRGYVSFNGEEFESLRVKYRTIITELGAAY